MQLQIVHNAVISLIFVLDCSRMHADMFNGSLQSSKSDPAANDPHLDPDPDYNRRRILKEESGLNFTLVLDHFLSFGLKNIRNLSLAY